jgi:hypothetical protein
VHGLRCAREQDLRYGLIGLARLAAKGLWWRKAARYRSSPALGPVNRGQRCGEWVVLGAWGRSVSLSAAGNARKR